MFHKKHEEKASRFGVDIHLEADKFENYHRSHGNKFKDWDRAFHTWLTNAGQYAKRDAPPKQYRQYDEGVARCKCGAALGQWGCTNWDCDK